MEGLTTLALEVVWMRVFIFYFGNSIYSYTIVAAMFIAGISLGGYIGSRIADGLRNRPAILGLIEVLVGITCFIASLLITWQIPSLYGMFPRQFLGSW